jgi:hypothetical protein
MRPRGALRILLVVLLVLSIMPDASGTEAFGAYQILRDDGPRIVEPRTAIDAILRAARSATPLDSDGICKCLEKYAENLADERRKHPEGQFIAVLLTGQIPPSSFRPMRKDMGGKPVAELVMQIWRSESFPLIDVYLGQVRHLGGGRDRVEYTPLRLAKRVQDEMVRR